MRREGREVGACHQRRRVEAGRVSQVMDGERLQVRPRPHDGGLEWAAAWADAEGEEHRRRGASALSGLVAQSREALHDTERVLSAEDEQWRRAVAWSAAPPLCAVLRATTRGGREEVLWFDDEQSTAQHRAQVGLSGSTHLTAAAPPSLTAQPSSDRLDHDIT